VGNAKYHAITGDIQQRWQSPAGADQRHPDLSKAEAGLMELNEEGMDVAQVIATHDRHGAAGAEEADVRVVTEVPEGLPEVIADERKIRRRCSTWCRMR
jgi:hypothetical protein